MRWRASLPKLGPDEEVLPLCGQGSLGEVLPDAIAGLALVLVDLRRVEVQVAGFQGGHARGRAGGAGADAEAETGDVAGAGVEADGAVECHGRCRGGGRSHDGFVGHVGVCLLED